MTEQGSGTAAILAAFDEFAGNALSIWTSDRNLACDQRDSFRAMLVAALSPRVGS